MTKQQLEPAAQRPGSKPKQGSKPKPPLPSDPLLLIALQVLEMDWMPTHPGQLQRYVTRRTWDAEDGNEWWTPARRDAWHHLLQHLRAEWHARKRARERSERIKASA